MTQERTDKLLAWLHASAVRAVKTAAQTACALIGTSVYISDVSWPLIGSAALLAAVLSLLTSLAGIPEVDDGASVLSLGKGKGDVDA